MPSPYRAVLFDFFGTLTRAVTRGPAHDRIARRLGCAPADFAHALNETFYLRATGAYGDSATALRALAESLGRQPSPHALRRALRARIRAVRADMAFRPDAVDVLRELRRRGMLLAVISDCGPELPELWPALPVAPLVHARVFSFETGRHKPDPSMYLIACDRLRVAPAECLYVGDGGSRELSGAEAVGMTAVRLAAPDLGRHLVFANDDDWRGLAVPSLTGVLALVGMPSTGYADRHAPVAERSRSTGRKLVGGGLLGGAGGWAY